MLKPLKKNIINGQVLKNYNDIKLDKLEEKIAHIHYPVIDAMPLPALDDNNETNMNNSLSGEDNDDLEQKRGLSLAPRMSLGFNLFEKIPATTTTTTDINNNNNPVVINQDLTGHIDDIDMKKVVSVNTIMSQPNMHNSIILTSSSNAKHSVSNVNELTNPTKQKSSNNVFVATASSNYNNDFSSPSLTAHTACNNNKLVFKEPPSYEQYTSKDHYDPKSLHLVWQGGPTPTPTQRIQHHRIIRPNYSKLILLDSNDTNTMAVHRLRQNLMRAKSTDMMELHHPLGYNNNKNFISHDDETPYMIMGEEVLNNIPPHASYRANPYFYNEPQRFFNDRLKKDEVVIPIEYKRAVRPTTSINQQVQPKRSFYLKNNQILNQNMEIDQRYANYLMKQSKMLNLSNNQIYLPNRQSYPTPFEQLNNQNNDELPLDIDYGFNYLNKPGGDVEHLESTANSSGNNGATIMQGSSCNCINIASCSKENLNEFLHSKDCLFFARPQQQQQQKNRYRMIHNRYNNPNYLRMKSFSHSDYNIQRESNVKLV
jgi:hypothetical protein